MSEKTRLWDASERALALIDYRDNVLDIVIEQDRRVIELNARAPARAALDLQIPVVLSTVGVEMGVNGPTISSLRAALPEVLGPFRRSAGGSDPKLRGEGKI